MPRNDRLNNYLTTEADTSDAVYGNEGGSIARENNELSISINRTGSEDTDAILFIEKATRYFTTRQKYRILQYCLDTVQESLDTDCR